MKSIGNRSLERWRRTTFVPSQSLNSDRIKVDIAIDHERALLGVVQDDFETPLKKRAAPVM
jgi:hypothetical protein